MLPSVVTLPLPAFSLPPAVDFIPPALVIAGTNSLARVSLAIRRTAAAGVPAAPGTGARDAGFADDDAIVGAACDGLRAAAAADVNPAADFFADAADAAAAAAAAAPAVFAFFGVIAVAGAVTLSSIALAAAARDAVSPFFGSVGAGVDAAGTGAGVAVIARTSAAIALTPAAVAFELSDGRSTSDELAGPEPAASDLAVGVAFSSFILPSAGETPDPGGDTTGDGCVETPSALGCGVGAGFAAVITAFAPATPGPAFGIFAGADFAAAGPERAFGTAVGVPLSVAATLAGLFATDCRVNGGCKSPGFPMEVSTLARQ